MSGKRKSQATSSSKGVSSQQSDKKKPKQSNITFEVVPHVSNPDSVIGQEVKVPGSYWNDCDEDDAKKLYKCVVVRCVSPICPRVLSCNIPQSFTSTRLTPCVHLAATTPRTKRTPGTSGRCHTLS
jgi:hypothetical protein